MIGKHDLQINDGPELLSLEALQQRGRWPHRTRNNRREVQSRVFRVHGASTAKGLPHFVQGGRNLFDICVLSAIVVTTC